MNCVQSSLSQCLQVNLQLRFFFNMMNMNKFFQLKVILDKNRKLSLSTTLHSPPPCNILTTQWSMTFHLAWFLRSWFKAPLLKILLPNLSPSSSSSPSPRSAQLIEKRKSVKPGPLSSLSRSIHQQENDQQFSKSLCQFFL